MGLDGGTIITRNDVLRGQCWDLAKADDSRSSRGGCVRGTFKRRKLDKTTSKVTGWSTCALSGQPLAAPIVACFLGRLYNRSAVLEWLLAKAGHFSEEADAHRYINQLREAGDRFDHIASIKDVFALQYAPEPTAEPAVATAANGAADPVLPAPYTCPITELRCDRYPFAALRPCGHIFSERALKQAAADGTCPTCGAPFVAGGEEDVIPLLPDDEEQIERLRALLPTRRKQQKQKKDKGKDKGKGKAAEQQQQQQGEGGEQQPAAPAAAAAVAAEKPPASPPDQQARKQQQQSSRAPVG